LKRTAIIPLGVDISSSFPFTKTDLISKEFKTGRIECRTAKLLAALKRNRSILLDLIT
jgi:hypothetical protein